MIEVQDVRDMGEALGNAGAVLRANAGSAGLNAPVPTCAGWSVADLVAHTGQVHRWAAAQLAHRPLQPEAEVLAEAGSPARLVRHGIRDEYALIAPPTHLYAHYRLDEAGIEVVVRETIG